MKLSVFYAVVGIGIQTISWQVRTGLFTLFGKQSGRQQDKGVS